jgi:hypothetical protein
VDKQLSFDGREVAGIVQKWGGVESDSLPKGMTREQLAALEVGDEVLTVVRWRVEAKNHDEKSDTQGFGVKPFLRHLLLRQLTVDFEVTEIDKAGFERKTRLQEQATA